ncbi:CotH kinase family protein [Goodfellowiella coeruleoviolacea]|uniref:Chitobiase/beta-hexosaminidase C-terminal domain-containing protein n=1 Tax=Goodfellowiella coeruleoviolacea TaxID=334858 RepID=A0AAE3GM87_9PSEU|nr:CotH kinase family protein [Goodfellowiella coeruleoviolacea]MCP2170133.1 Chitobiase/beta-hexosaminidase C-terminal domain-containing protein [Goodfellowiella coeruleoviolacea]
MRLTPHSTGVAVPRRTTGFAVTAVLLAGLLIPYPSSAGAAPGSNAPPDSRAASTAAGTGTTDTDTAAADADAAAAAADDLTGDITFSVPSGTFQGQVAVSLSTTVSGAQIRYTTDGRLPTAQSALYQGSALQFTRTTQLRAQAFVGQTASGAPGTAMYVARGTTTTTHDLPVILIDSYGAGKPGREYFDAATMIFQPGSGGTTSIASAPTVATRAGLRLRGQSSATFEKTPYRVEFWDNDNDDADYPVLGMPADSDWVLRGPFTDKALIREALSYDLGREMGLQAPRYAFAELYLNTDATPVNANDYMGVYLMVETIKNTKNRLDLEKLHEDDRTLPEIQGGYIWKFEWMAAEEPTLPCSGPAATCWNYLEVADPSPLQPEQRDWLRNHIQEFHNVLRAPNFADPVTGYPAYIDVGSFVDQLIINELSREMDSYVRSAYFYKDRYTKIFAGPLWDYDLSFGVGGYFQNDQTAGWQYQQTRQPLANDWFTQLLRDPAFVDQVRSRWQTLRRGLLSDAALQSRIDALARPLTNAAQRNFQRWPNLSTALIGFFITPTAPTWQGQVQYLRDWMQRRIAWLDSPAGWGGTTTPPGTGGCSATYTVTNQWSGGFQGEVRVTAGSAAINNWTVSWTFTSGETISQAWNATVTSQGAAVTARNATHNGSVAAGASTTFGFLGTSTAAPGRPALTCTGS